MTADLEKRVRQYVEVRDRIAELKEKHKAELAPFNKAQEMLANFLLNHLITVGADSINTKGGTFYKIKKVTASIVDMDAFWKHVKDNEEWELLDRRANKTAVEAYVLSMQAPPPGVNYSKTEDVGVHRKS